MVVGYGGIEEGAGAGAGAGTDDDVVSEADAFIVDSFLQTSASRAAARRFSE
jgi:hypothetical protein